VAGVYWWEVHPEERWIQDYSPLGKPAEQVMSLWNAQPDLGQGPDTVPQVVAPTAPAAPAPRPPAPPAAAPAAAAPRVTLKLRPSRVRGFVTPYSPGCPGTVTLRVRRWQDGRWRWLKPPRAFRLDGHGTFSLPLDRRVRRVSAMFRSRCFTVGSAWVTTKA
jgi:hypothetical protein